MIKKTDIPNDTVTYAKMQNAEGANVVVGNSGSAGDPIKELSAAELAGIVDGELLIDEDDMVSDLDTKAPTQQSTKAYVDGEIAGLSTPDVVLVSTVTASAASNVTFTDLSSTYHTYEIRFSNVYPSVDIRSFALRTSSNNGSSYDSGASDYTYVNTGGWGTSVGTGSGTTSYIGLANTMGTAANELAHGVVTVFNPSASTYTHVRCDYNQINNAGTHYVGMIAGYRASAAAVDAIEISILSANITGTFKLYGYK